jgi:PAS domain S-box-containing protein
MIWMSGLDKEPTYFNQLWLDFTGLSETDLLNGLAGIVHPDDYLQCHEVYCRGFDQRQPFRKECRLRRHDGQYRWILDVGVPRLHKDGSFAGYIGSCIDVTDHKLAEDALTSMSRKLVQAQEQERSRIARELHDDISQRLAMLGIDLQQLREHYPELPVEISGRVEELQEQTTGISNDVQALSHQLHSSKLEYLGALGGMKSWCNEFGERQGLQIEFKSPDAQISLPPEIGLCLFRVLQEALHNATKHSGVKRIEVQLREDLGEICLVVSDLGRGFDVETAVQGRGLGLASMQERVRLVNGTIEIQSKPMGGTTVHVRVPLSSENAFQRTAG